MSGVEQFMTANNKGVSSLKKRTLGIVLVLLAAVGLMAPAIAAADNIGYVDFEFLFYAHPEYDAKNQELQDKVEELYQEAQAKAEELETEEEIEELSHYYERQFDQIEQEVRVQLVFFILNIIEQVAQENGISTVLPEDSIIYGGTNLTASVVEAMYKSYGISVPSSIRDLL